MTEIRKVAVFGAGVMGAGIAAHVANAGVPVQLLDIVPDGAGDRDAIARSAIQKMLKASPAPFMHRANARLITPGNTEDHMDRIADCDWIIEAIAERLDLKHALYEKIDAHRGAGSVVSSNTSTIPLQRLTEGASDAFAADFLVTHFFNPPRYMRLLELVAGPRTRADAAAAIRQFCDLRLGKGVVGAKDTPGFIANRLGIYWLQSAVREALSGGVTVEEADAAMGRPIGVPKTGVFGLLDMVGLDLMPHVLGGLAEALPKGDPFHDVYEEPELLKRMIADGYTGRKGKGGFYRLKPGDKNRTKEAVDLATGEYRTAARPKPRSVAAARKGGPRALVEHPDQVGGYAWRVLSNTLSYAAFLVPEAADDITAIDDAMRLGYNWKSGPFELIDQLGAGWFADKLRAEGRPVPPLLETAAGRPFYRTEQGRLQYLDGQGQYQNVRRAAGVLMLADIKRAGKPLLTNKSASLWDIGDGVACLEFHSKMNSLNPLTLWMVQKSVKRARDRCKALVIYNEGSNFSVGANIGLFLYGARLRLWPLLGLLIRWGQGAYEALKRAPFPVVGAPSGMALGGGCEVLLHCDAIQAHAETYTGLVEVGVGIIPGWGGCKEMLLRWRGAEDSPRGPMPPVIKSFEAIATATVAKSAFEARDLRFLRAGDRITMNRDRLLADAKARALELAENYAAPAPEALSLPGLSGKAALSMAVEGFRRLGHASPHDVVVGGVLAGVLSGGDTDITESLNEDDLLKLEQKGFARLAKHPASIARVAHMLKTGKPLRN